MASPRRSEMLLDQLEQTLAEAWRKEDIERIFVSKLTESDAEFAETQHWVDTVFACAYITGESHADKPCRIEKIDTMMWSKFTNSERWVIG